MNLSIPNRITKKLEDDRVSYANIINLIENVSNYYTLSPCFFPDYTIHGIDHVNNVLDMADHLIPDRTLVDMQSRELSLLISAVILHDIGMFITEDGFNSLISGKHADNMIPELDSLSWRDSWSAYCQRIKRYPDRKLLNTFGSSDPIYTICTDPSQMNRQDYLVCGEFIRQQHHRLAHEIAQNGFMGSADVDIFQNTTFSTEECNLIGLLARSHGMAIRDTEQYLSAFFPDVSMPLGYRIFYLMAVVRIADYLDAGQHRAPKNLENRQHINVPISHSEWAWNRVIRYENYHWAFEHKNLVIQADPKTTSFFVKTEKWLKSVQYELDLSWAILMEYYPSQTVRLSIHRVDSNILNHKNRNIMNKNFLITETKLSVNPDILQLLIKPLYGDNPTFGVRELLQNAVDACIERKYLEKNKDYSGEVCISIDSTLKTFTITDNGLGMNEDVLRNYFLSIGSSYRYSENWMNSFMENQHPTVVRSGKFGIGILSVFLLGDSVQVQTHYLKDSKGYSFNFSMTSKIIDVSCIDCPIGTKIIIQLNDKTLSALKKTSYSEIHWSDWYAFSFPVVRYYLDGDEINKPKSRKFVPQKDGEFSEWLSFNSSNYESFQWTFKKYSPIFYCNGIRINSIHNYRIGDDYGYSVRVPSISLVDRKANLSLDLSRSTIFQFPDEKDFLSDVYRYILAKLLMTPWDSDQESIDRLSYGFSPYSSYIWSNPFYIFSNHGFTLSSSSFLLATGVRHVLGLGYHAEKLPQNFYLTSSSIPVIFTKINRKQVGRTIYDEFLTGSKFHFKSHATRLWGKESEFNKVLPTFPKYFSLNFQKRPTVSGFVSYSQKDYVPNACSRICKTYLHTRAFPIAAEYEITSQDLDNIPEEKNLMLKLIRRYLGQDAWIPIDMMERRQKFPKAFEDLKYYIDRL